MSELRALNISKQYPGTLALDDVSVCFPGGKIHALLGKNGAGKSTLVKILSGTTLPTSGQVLVNNTPVTLRTAQDAFNHGIATVYQELSLIPGLTVAENIFLGRLPHRRVSGASVIDWPATFDRAQAVVDSIHVNLNLRMNVSDLSVAQQQTVEIAKAMSFNPSVLILDEPTSALARHETQSLFELLRKLASRGVAIIYITHRLQELRQVCDTVTVLRDGKIVGHAELNDTTPESIIRMMFGQVVHRKRPADLIPGSDPVLHVRHLTRQDKFHDISFTLHRGEILGIAGMLGSGRTELLRAIFGADPFDEGELDLAGQRIPRPDPVTMKRLGVAMTSEDRKHQSLIQSLSTRANLCLASLDRIATAGFTTRLREQPIVRGMIDRLDIALSDAEAPVSVLSGGNQQKVVVGKWLATAPRIILFDEPTRGIDVHAKQQIFRLMWDLSRDGIASIFVSSELEELLEACHRILIMKQGRIREELSPETIGPDELYVRCMTE